MDKKKCCLLDGRMSQGCNIAGSGMSRENYFVLSTLFILGVGSNLSNRECTWYPLLNRY